MKLGDWAFSHKPDNVLLLFSAARSCNTGLASQWNYIPGECCLLNHQLVVLIYIILSYLDLVFSYRFMTHCLLQLTLTI